MYWCSLDYHHPSSSSCIFLVCIIGWVLGIAGVGWLKKFVSTLPSIWVFWKQKSFCSPVGRERESLLCVFPSFRLCSKWTRRNNEMELVDLFAGVVGNGVRRNGHDVALACLFVCL
jgi:hypothetical protein